ncbi:vWA domain-containing protein [Acanthopleuribacter pedis]|uniref:VWA domain-containing protein n=1 Tax=Acanthopleuribacter pedis TaxID=442870 RepID=A0A8J7Q7Z3_9BACT|nr:VWA domain-containing protein [Acanthopleuribacter pedis]MBO1319317.1 VWA domain-containing protein [Acanthopleuribacter pedis]
MKTWFGLWLLCLTPLLAADTHIQLILDASGSMWNKFEDGRYRITTAKDVLQQVVNSLPAENAGLQVGLRIYGSRVSHKENGACDDTALFVPMSGVDRDQLLKTIRKARALGATPIAKSLTAAAADFSGIQGKKSIILVTDGLESCGGDVEAAVAKLKEAGVDVDLRIIGLDLDDQAVAVFSRYATLENVADAASLSKVLSAAVEEQVTLERKQLPVTVRLTRKGKAVTDAKVMLVDPVKATQDTFSLSQGRYQLSTPPGSFDIAVDDVHSGPKVFSGIAVNADQKNEFSFELAPESDASLRVSVKEAVAGSAVTVFYEGAPTGGEPWITIVTPEQSDGAYRDWKYAPDGKGQVTIYLPGEVGPMEARLVATQPMGGEIVLARAEVTATKPEISLDVAANLPGGNYFEAFWTGPDNPGDFITIVPAGSAPGAYESYQYTKKGSPSQLLAKPEAGDYEVRYVSGENKVLASTRVVIQGATADLEAPQSAMAGGKVTVSWQGPNGPGDYISVAEAGSNDTAYSGYAYTKDGKALAIDLPVKPGAYELRYMVGSGDKLLARRPLTLTPAKITLDAPDKVKTGAPIEIKWQGPDGASDYITIVKVGAAAASYGDYRYTRDGSPATLTAPNEAGTYEIRYNNERAGAVLAKKAITVE